MPNFNKVILAGHLTRDPQMRSVGSAGTPLCEFGLAVNRKFKTKDGEKREKTAYFDCNLWGKGGDIFMQYTGKGDPVLVEGSLDQQTWEDKNGGGKRSKILINVDTFQFLGGNYRKDEEKRQHTVPPNPDNFVMGNDEEVPF